MSEYSEIYARVLQDAVRRADHTFQNFFLRIKKGEKPGYPRYKSRFRYNSFTYSQSGFSLENGYLNLSKLGNIKIVKHRKISGTIKTLTIKRDSCDNWWATFIVDIGDAPVKHPVEKPVGVDVGISNLATLSTGQFFENKKHVMNQEKKLKRLDRQLSQKKKASENRKKAQLIRARSYRKLQNQRRDYLHKISRYLVENFDLIVFEDLQIKSMMKNHHLAKSISDGSWGMLTRFTTYKAEEAGKTVVLVDPNNTSQECSNCGTIVRKSLSVRTHMCPNCLFFTDRDLNSSFNIKHRGLKKIGWEPPESTSVEIGVQSLENISPWLSRSKKQKTPSILIG